MSLFAFRRLLTIVAGLACLVLAGAVGWLIGVEFPPGRGEHPGPPILGQAPSYKGLTNQLGQSVDSSRFEGRVQVVTFLFPYCTTYCPLIAAHLVGLEHLLEDANLASRVQIVAFDVDPQGTGPEQMRAFLKEYGWDPSNLHWQYLTGKPKEIRRVVTGGFHIAYRKAHDNGASAQDQGPAQTPQPIVVNRLAQKANVNYDISHNDGIVIVDPAGNIRRIYDQADVLSNRRLLKAIRTLLPSRGKA